MKLTNLRKVRHEAGLSQVQLAERLYSNQGHISLIERGSNVSKAMARRTADALGCGVEDLLDPEIGRTLKALKK